MLLLYVDDKLDDATPFGTVRRHAFTIIPRDELQIAGLRLAEKPTSKLALRWQLVDELAERTRKHLRPLYVTLDFSTAIPAARG